MSQSADYFLSKLIVLATPEIALSGSQTTLDIAARLGSYPWNALLGAISRVDILLTQTRNSRTSPSVQREILDGLFGEERAREIVVRLARFEAQHGSTLICFHRRGLLNAVKLHCLATDTAWPTDANSTFAHLGEALIGINGVSEPEVLNPADPGDKLKLEVYTTANLASSKTFDMAGCGRAFEFLQIGRALPQNAGLLSSGLVVGTGLDPFEYLAFIQGLAAMLASVNKAGLDRGDNILAMPFLSAGRKLNAYEAIVAKAAQHIAWAPDSLTTAIRDRYSVQNLRGLDFLPLERRPLVLLGDRLFCVDRGLLQDRAGLGILHSAMDPEVMDEKARRRVLDHKGMVFEEYVRRILKRIPDRVRFVDSDEIKAYLGESEASDFILLGDRFALIVEVKAAVWELSVRNGESVRAYERFFAEQVVKAVRQMNAARKALESGWYASLVPGMKTAPLCIPVLITLGIQSEHFVFGRAFDTAKAQTDAPVEFLKRLQLLDVEDAERLECIALGGTTVAELLVKKSMSFKAAAMTLAEYFTESDHPAANRRSEFLLAKTRQAFDSAQRIVAAVWSSAGGLSIDQN